MRLLLGRSSLRRCNAGMLGRLILFSLLAGSASPRTLSHECSGYAPEDCSRRIGCKTCWDGRLDCYDASQQVYGNFWCENPAASKKSACGGLSESTCAATPGCVYCRSAAVGNQCYTSEDAKKLPAAIFTCSWTLS